MNVTEHCGVCKGVWSGVADRREERLGGGVGLASAAGRCYEGDLP
ncbi:MAG: hypothetical protein ACO3FA_08850 [Vulcanococcus sp.]